MHFLECRLRLAINGCTSTTQARRLIERLRLTWDDVCFRFNETKRVVRTASLSQVRMPIYTSSKVRSRRSAAA
jgi:hypothetical protein